MDVQNLCNSAPKGWTKYGEIYIDADHSSHFVCTTCLRENKRFRKAIIGWDALALWNHVDKNHLGNQKTKKPREVQSMMPPNLDNTFFKSINGSCTEEQALSQGQPPPNSSSVIETIIIDDDDGDIQIDGNDLANNSSYSNTDDTQQGTSKKPINDDGALNLEVEKRMAALFEDIESNEEHEPMLNDKNPDPDKKGIKSNPETNNNTRGSCSGGSTILNSRDNDSISYYFNIPTPEVSPSRNRPPLANKSSMNLIKDPAELPQDRSSNFSRDTTFDKTQKNASHPCVASEGDLKIRVTLGPQINWSFINQKNSTSTTQIPPTAKNNQQQPTYQDNRSGQKILTYKDYRAQRDQSKFSRHTERDNENFEPCCTASLQHLERISIRESNNNNFLAKNYEYPQQSTLTPQRIQSRRYTYREFKCSDCGVRTITAESMETHKTRLHNRNFKDNTVFDCCICNKRLSMKSFENHMRTHADPKKRGRKASLSKILNSQ